MERAKSATGRILADSGYEALSMGAVADGAGVSKGTLYQYFPHKDAVVAAVVDDVMEDLVAAFGRRLRDSLAAGDATIGPGLLTSVFAELDRHRPMLAAVLAGAPDLLPAGVFDPIADRWSDATRALLARRPRGTADPAVDGEALVTILSVSGRALCLHYLALGRPDQRESLARTFYSMAYGGLTGAGLAQGD